MPSLPPHPNYWAYTARNGFEETEESLKSKFYAFNTKMDTHNKVFVVLGKSS